MRLIDQKADVWGVVPDSYIEAVPWIARAGRVCYASEPKGPDGEFVAKRLKPDPPHSSILEHSNLAVKGRMRVDEFLSFITRYGLNTRWLNRRHLGNSEYCVFGNLRAWFEALKVKDVAEVYDWVNRHDLGMIPSSELTHEMVRVTAEIVTDRAVLAEITRHRDDVGFSVESQRYVDYNGGDVAYVKPSWFDQATAGQRSLFYDSCIGNENMYKELRKHFPPQHARVVLSNQARTVIVMTAYLPQWEWIFKLRRSSAAYPQMILVMDEIHRQFQSQGLA